MTSKLEGFDELINLFDEMKLKDEEVTSGLRKALKIPKEIAQKNSPVRTGRTRDSIKIKIQKGELGGSTGIVYVSDYRGMFQEFRNTRQKGIHVGWFERSIKSSEEQVVVSLKKTLIDEKVK